MGGMKTCTLCGETKPFEEFTKHRQMKDGLSYWCKICNNARTKAFRESPSGIYTQIKSRLKFRRAHLERRGLPKIMSLSREDFVIWYKGIQKLCAYCSIPEELLSDWDDSHNNKVHRLTVDCINNSIGYTKENLLLACLRCNGIKSDIFDYETMREIGQKYIRPIWEMAVTKVNKDE